MQRRLNLVSATVDTRSMHERDFIDGYDAHQDLKGLSDATRRRRRWTITEFGHHLEVRGRTFADATMVDVELFLAGHGGPSTRRALLGDVRCFYRWARSRELVPIDPTERLEQPRVPSRTARPLSAFDLEIAVRSARPRLRAILMLGALAGLRVSEIATLMRSDVEVERRVIVVRGGKGGKDRIVPLHSELVGAVDVVPRRRDGRVIGTSGQNVGDIVRAHFRLLRIDHRAHDLRATFATNLAQASAGNMSLVAGLLGHASMLTTQRYCAWVPDGGEYVEMLHAA